MLPAAASEMVECFLIVSVLTAMMVGVLGYLAVTVLLSPLRRVVTIRERMPQAPANSLHARR
jgi:hypothetical protein